MSDRLVRFPGASWQEIEALPQPLRWTVQHAIFHLLDEPIPTLADPFPSDDPLPGACELHLPSDNGSLYTPHSTSNTVDVITGPFTPGTAYTAVTPCNANSAPTNCPASGYPANSLGTINLKTGAVGNVALNGIVMPKGMVFFP